MANLGQKESAHFPSKEQLLKVSSKKRKTEGKKKKKTPPKKGKENLKIAMQYYYLYCHYHYNLFLKSLTLSFY